MVRPTRGLCKHCPVQPRANLGRMAAGGVIIAVVMLLILPIAIMLGGAIWSALLGFLLVEDADARTPTP